MADYYYIKRVVIYMPKHKRKNKEICIKVVFNLKNRINNFSLLIQFFSNKTAQNLYLRTLYKIIMERIYETNLGEYFLKLLIK